MEKTFYLVRHGQTDWNKERRLQGSMDVPMNDEGRSQARDLAKFFDEHPVDILFSSPLQRAFETLAIATGSDDIIRVADLHEVALGPLEGKLHSEVVAEFGEEAWKTWMEFPPGSEDFRFPGSESPRQSTERAKSALRRLAQDYQFKKAAVCTHGFLLRRLLQDLDPVSPSRIIPNGLIAEIKLAGERLTLVRTLATTSSFPL